MTDLVQVEAEQGAAVMQQLPFNLTQLLAFAMQKPRDMEKAIGNAIAQLRATPQFAEKAYYTLPFKRADGSTEYAEGPSIKAATALTGCWGNNVEGGYLGKETPDYVDTFGYFFDYETGKLTIRPWRVSKTYRTREGKVVPWRYDMLLKQIQAGVSKAIRNADLNGLPAGLVAEYFAEAKRIAARGGKPLIDGEPAESTGAAITAQIERSIKRFEGMGVSREDVAEYILRHPELDTEEVVSAHFIGVLNALDDRQTTIEEVFMAQDEGIAEPQRTTPAAQEPAAPAPSVSRGTPNAAGTKGKPPHRRRMQSKLDGTTCRACKKPIKKGDWIYKNEETGNWQHEETC